MLSATPSRGEVATLRGWLDALPVALVERDYDLTVSLAWVQYLLPKLNE